MYTGTSFTRKAGLLGAAISLLSGTLLAGTWDGGGSDTLWHTPTNWVGDVVPTSATPTVLSVNGNATVLLNSASWSYFQSNLLLSGGATGMYTGVNRFLVGTNVSPTGTQTLTFDYGDGNIMAISDPIGQGMAGRNGQTSTLNIVSGNTSIASSTFTVGSATGATGTINVTGGQLEFSRAAPTFGTNGGTGTLHISGGSFTTRGGVTVDGGGTWSVEGSGATQIGIGTSGNGDGNWNQLSGGLLEVGVDAGGLSKIFIDNKEVVPVTSATFASGSLLGVDYLGAFSGVGSWTVLEVENGSITNNGLAFAPGVDTSIWSFNVDNSGANGLLTVTAIPEPGTLLLLGIGLVSAFALRRHRR